LGGNLNAELAALPPQTDEATREGVFEQEAVEELDDELDRAAGSLLSDLQRVTHANMAEEIDLFIRALDAERAWSLGAPKPAATALRAPGASLKDVGREAARRAERQVICEAMRAAKGNKSEAARALLTDFKTLHVKMKSLGLRARDFEI